MAPGSPTLDVGSPLINNSSTPVGTLFQFTSGFPYVSIQLDDTSDDTEIFDDNELASHVITDGQGLVENGTQVESESFHFFRALEADGNEVGPVITVTVFSKGGDFEDVWGMAADAPFSEGVIYRKIDGSNVGDSTYSDFVPCFAAGTYLTGPSGNVDVADLRAGDRLFTRDNGFQEIAWIGRKDLGGHDLARDPKLWPVRIPASALGKEHPGRDLILSPNHRVLLTGPEIALNFGTPEVFVAAKFLLGRPGVTRGSDRPVSYYHILFEGHEVVLSNDSWTESFLPGPQALTGVAAAQSEELFALFPELRTQARGPKFKAARQILSRREAVLTA